MGDINKQNSSRRQFLKQAAVLSAAVATSACSSISKSNAGSDALAP